MKGGMGRSRSIGRLTESPQRERDPFSNGLHRQKSSPIAEAPKRRNRSNMENVAPDGANNNVQDCLSPAPCKTVSKGSKTPGALKESSVCGSPALMPKMPKPSPGRCVQPLGQNQGALNQVPPQGPGPDQPTCAKRKLNLDIQAGGVMENLMSAATVDTSDTGVKVIVRMRPLNKKEAAEEATMVVQKLSANSLSLADQQFTYDAVAGETESQEAVFKMVGLPMVENCLAGFNSSIFAYGQTGSGKTHTMWGPMPGSSTALIATEERGITPRVFEQLFARIQQEERNNVEKQLRYQCRCSFLEIYNEQITDLLEPSQKNLMIREDTKTGVYVEGLTEEYVSNMDDITRLLVRGLANRRVGSTAMNNESSRSHSVFTFVIESRSKSAAEGASSVRTSRMNLVDLAGSERQKQTGAAGERLKEAGNINKSLSQLGNVINILAEVAQNGKHRHIPYRDSRLTFLLQESLGGNAKLAMICAVSPASSCRTETLSTLRFAQRAKAMQNKAVVNEETANDVNLLREQIRQLKDELMRMKENTTPPEGGPAGGFSNGWNARRSYNLLRLSLNQPMTMSSISMSTSEFKDIEKEIEAQQQVQVHEDKTCLHEKVSIVGNEAKDLLPKSVGTIEEAEPESKHLEHDAEGAAGTGPGCLVPSGTDFPELIHSLIAPALSVSPNVKEMDRKEPGADTTFGLQKSPLSLKMRSSTAFRSSTDQLAASLTRGIEILDSQVRNSRVRNSSSLFRRSAAVHFSFQNGDSPNSTRDAMLRRLICSSNTPLTQPYEPLASPMQQIPSTPPRPAQIQSPAAGELSPWPQITPDGSCRVIHSPLKEVPDQGLEILLAGAMRRERAAEDTILQQAAEIEQLNRLVCQYKLERECNAILQQSREEKIARMECLMDGVLPPEEFRKEEWAALQMEHNMLQQKFDHHPELAEAKAAHEKLQLELQEYKKFCDLGERSALQEEIMHLQSQLHVYLDSKISGSSMQCQLPPTPQKADVDHSPVKELCLDAVPEAPSSSESSSLDQLKNELSESKMEGSAGCLLEQERMEWDKREKEWMSVVQGLREECDHHSHLAERIRKELEGEKRCSQEMHDALQMAMTGHARLLDQYAELQEKHILLLAKMREIREGVNDIKKVAKKSGLSSIEDRWFEVQATQIVFMKVEQDQYKAEIKGLQAQLRDTAEAVQAAGEVLVRMKEAEQSAATAKEAAAAAEQDADQARRDLEKSTRRHAKELSALQQRLLQSGPQMSAPCSVCGAMDNMDTHSSKNEANLRTVISLGAGFGPGSKISGVNDSWGSNTDSWTTAAVIMQELDKKSVLDSWSSGKDEVDDDVEIEDEEADAQSSDSRRIEYQQLETSEVEYDDDDVVDDHDDDDEFLCETCGQPATNGLRVCDACI